MSRTSETPGSGAASEFRCGACENCRRDPKTAKIMFPNCAETPDWHCGACDNCREKYSAIQLPNCHEVEEIRCSCGKCLARDGKIKCPRCDGFTDARTRVLLEARHTAFYLCALATSSQILEEGSKPIMVTLVPAARSLGYVQTVPAEDRFAYTSDELNNRLVVLLTGLAAEEALGGVTTGSSNTFQQAMELARRIVSYGMVEGWDTNPDAAARQLFETARQKAKEFVAANRTVIDNVAAQLLFKGELTQDDLARLIPPPAGTTGGAADAQA